MWSPSRSVRDALGAVIVLFAVSGCARAQGRCGDPGACYVSWQVEGYQRRTSNDGTSTTRCRHDDMALAIHTSLIGPGSRSFGIHHTNVDASHRRVSVLESDGTWWTADIDGDRCAVRDLVIDEPTQRVTGVIDCEAVETDDGTVRSFSADFDCLEG
jgi:hypothetical protein